MSFRNRCQISGAQGVIDLSIPLVGGRDQKGLTHDVRIDGGRSWQDQHWKTIVSCYNRSPWFDYYRDSLEQLFRKPADFLTNWNLDCFEWTLRALGWTPPVGLTTAYRREYPAEEGADWRGKLMPRDREKWETGLLEGSTASRHHQVFEDRTGFIPNLSILDLIFCEGKEAIRYLRS